MSWVKIDDGFTDHPKVEALSDRAFRLHVAGLCFCARTLSDGFIPDDRIRRLLPKVTKGMVAELVDGRVWERADGGVIVVGYLEYNPSKAAVEKERQEAAERRRRWREKKDRDGERDASRDAAPSRPVPSRRDKGRVSEEPSAVDVSPAPSGGDTQLPEDQIELNVSAIRAAREALSRVSA